VKYFSQMYNKFIIRLGVKWKLHILTI
jgi:hypothetical protein